MTRATTIVLLHRLPLAKTSGQRNGARTMHSLRRRLLSPFLLPSRQPILDRCRSLLLSARPSLQLPHLRPLLFLPRSLHLAPQWLPQPALLVPFRLGLVPPRYQRQHRQPHSSLSHQVVQTTRVSHWAALPLLHRAVAASLPRVDDVKEEVLHACARTREYSAFRLEACSPH